MQFSEYVVYADESGDHSLVSINPAHPVFVLTFCIFQKDHYASTLVPSIQQLKFGFWGHDAVILHGHEIRKEQGDFNILRNAATRSLFIEKLNNAIESANFTVIAAVIDKARHMERYKNPDDPYSIAMVFCMERLQRFLTNKEQSNRLTHVLVECRGKSEDAKLELAFRRICDGNNAVGKMPNLELRFMDKKHNSTGLQLADLVAHPIGRHIINPAQPNRAYDIIAKKFRRSAAGQVKGFGLKIFP